MGTRSVKEFEELLELVKPELLAVMEHGEKHPEGHWKTETAKTHWRHIRQHLRGVVSMDGHSGQPNLAHLILRAMMAMVQHREGYNEGS